MLKHIEVIKAARILEQIAAVTQISFYSYSSKEINIQNPPELNCRSSHIKFPDLTSKEVEELAEHLNSAIAQVLGDCQEKLMLKVNELLQQ